MEKIGLLLFLACWLKKILHDSSLGIITAMMIVVAPIYRP